MQLLRLSFANLHNNWTMCAPRSQESTCRLVLGTCMYSVGTREVYCATSEISRRKANRETHGGRRLRKATWIGTRRSCIARRVVVHACNFSTLSTIYILPTHQRELQGLLDCCKLIFSNTFILFFLNTRSYLKYHIIVMFSCNTRIFI